MAAARGAGGATQEEARHPPGIESPLRAELFSAEQMERHGGVLAGSHHLQAKRQSESLLRRLADNQRVLEEARERLAAAAVANRGITPAGEWMLDNFYVIDEQIRTARRHLPRDCVTSPVFAWRLTSTLLSIPSRRKPVTRTAIRYAS